MGNKIGLVCSLIVLGAMSSFQLQANEEEEIKQVREASERLNPLLSQFRVVERLEEMRKAGKTENAILFLRDFRTKNQLKGIDAQVIMMAELEFYQDQVRRQMRSIREILAFLKEIVAQAPTSYLSKKLFPDIQQIEEKLKLVDPNQAKPAQ